MSGQSQVQEPKGWKAILIAFIIGILDIIVLFLGTSNVLPIAGSVGSVGVITFFGVLMLVNYLSKSKVLDKGEMRKAIAASFVVIYFALLSLLTFTGFGPSNTELAETIIGHFTYLVGIIIVFYFGSRTVEKYIEKRGPGISSEEESGSGGAESDVSAEEGKTK